MATAAMPLNGTERQPVPVAPPTVPAARADVPAAPDTVPDAPKRDYAETAGRALLAVVVLGGAALAAIGFAGSYKSLSALATAKGFGDFAPWFPIGVDAGIIVALAADLYLVRRGTSWPFLRPLAHLLTAATVWFNASSGPRPVTEDPLAAAMHAVMPVLFVAVVEACRFLVLRTARENAGLTEPEGIPWHRWFLNPTRTFAMWRRMKLWGVASYLVAVGLEQDLRVYRVMLKQKHGKVRHAPEVERLPLTMARYGLTVDEALALPQEAEEREQRRQEAEEAAKVRAAAAKAERAAQAQIAELRADGKVQAARHEVTAATKQAEVSAHAELVAAERAAEAEATALESVAAAEADARRAAAAKAAAEAREAAAEIDQRAAGTEADAAETRLRAAEADAKAATAEAATEAANRRRAEDAARAAEATERAAETRLRIAGIERRAAEVEDEARLNQKDRNVLRLARRALLEHGGDVDAIPLDAVAEEFSVSTTTASNYRKWAAERIAEGYRPEGI
ncbi:DUF2637 domain-containing protein [Streptomyces sp. NPDC048507]|uniref:DUF2637 domain-containing protein n=1 Tax=Streptomyces sp. NPDC048507 TaxID=3365560 RepID=UPI003722884D